MKVLILYYSKGGNTRKLAEAISEGVGQINGVEAVSGQPFVVPLKEKATSSTFSIEVASPDRFATSIYTVKVRVKT